MLLHTEQKQKINKLVNGRAKPRSDGNSGATQSKHFGCESD